MIVWNVTNRWFATKAEAETLRKQQKLSPTITRRADIRNRTELAALLDGQCRLPELHRANPKKADPNQIDMFADPEQPGTDTKAGLAAISLAGFPPAGDPAYDAPEPATEGHLESYEAEPEIDEAADGTRFDRDTGEVLEERP